MKELIELVKSLAPLITAATPVLLILVNWYVTHRQTRDLKAHSDENREAIKMSMPEKIVV